MLVSRTGVILDLESFVQEYRGKWSQYAQGEEGREDKLDSKSETTLGFIYTLDVLLSKLSWSVSVSSNDKVLTRRC